VTGSAHRSLASLRRTFRKAALPNARHGRQFQRRRGGGLTLSQHATHGRLRLPIGNGDRALVRLVVYHQLRPAQEDTVASAVRPLREGSALRLYAAPTKCPIDGHAPCLTATLLDKNIHSVRIKCAQDCRFATKMA